MCPRIALDRLSRSCRTVHKGGGLAVKGNERVPEEPKVPSYAYSSRTDFPISKLGDDGPGNLLTWSTDGRKRRILGRSVQCACAPAVE